MAVTRNVFHVKQNKQTSETVYLAASLSPQKAGPKRLLSLNREHWEIEALHHVRDVVFREDASTVRTANGPRIKAILHNLAISLLRLVECKNISRTLQNNALKPHLALRLVEL